MATIAASPLDAPTPTRTWRKGRVLRAALTRAWRKGEAVVSAARNHNWSPALTISGLGAIDTAAWETFGRGAGWGALGLSLLVFDWQRDR